jgi:hypothetical protein
MLVKLTPGEKIYDVLHAKVKLEGKIHESEIYE